jgi:hypothetical protein
MTHVSGIFLRHELHKKYEIMLLYFGDDLSQSEAGYGCDDWFFLLKKRNKKKKIWLIWDLMKTGKMTTIFRSWNEEDETFESDWDTVNDEDENNE